MFVHFTCNYLVVSIRQCYGNKIFAIYFSTFPLFNCLDDIVFIQPNNNGIHVLTMANINGALPMNSINYDYHDYMTMNSVKKYSKTQNHEADNCSVHKRLWMN